MLTKEEAKERCEYWQKILRLQDWDIEVDIVRAFDMRVTGLAECSWQLKKRVALINLRDPLDFAPDWFGSRDMELSLVHELLHLHLAPWSPEADTEEDLAEEQAIHAISGALVNLDRDLR